MAKVKSSGVAKGNKDSASKRLGIKVYGGGMVKAGNIIVRQRGTRFFAGYGTGIGKDYTIFASIDGTIKFLQRNGRKYVTVQTP